MAFRIESLENMRNIWPHCSSVAGTSVFCMVSAVPDSRSAASLLTIAHAYGSDRAMHSMNSPGSTFPACAFASNSGETDNDILTTSAYDAKPRRAARPYLIRNDLYFHSGQS